MTTRTQTMVTCDGCGSAIPTRAVRHGLDQEYSRVTLERTEASSVILASPREDFCGLQCLANWLRTRHQVVGKIVAA